mmetsp:Transcript_74081/g.130975  ORF Transcript_74081/g.130975 Transcript_74081/m.130975 type:complete len:673 (-) Transcript_74081:115-2133(-)
MLAGIIGPALQLLPSNLQSRTPQRPNLDGPLLRSLREEFRQCGGSETAAISAEDLARHWYRLIEEDRREHGKTPLDSQERSAIALRAAQATTGMGLRSNGFVYLDEFLHDRLLAASKLPSPALAAQINAALQFDVNRKPLFLAEVQWLFEVADTSHTGFLALEDVSQAYNSGLWRLSATSEGLKTLSDSEIQFSDPDKLAWDLFQAADLDGRPNRLSYAELLAFCLRRQKEVVSLALYDLSDGLAKTLSPYLLGKTLDGLWHSSIIVFGIEYFFGGDVCRCLPGQTKFGKPTKMISLGNTLRTPTELQSFLDRRTRSDFTRQSYDVLHHNCNNFSDSVSQYLVGRRIPEEVLRLPDAALQAPAMLKPLLNGWLSRAEAQARSGRNAGGRELRPPPLERQPHASEMQPMGNGQVVSVLPVHGQAAQTALGQVWMPGSGSKGPPLPPAPPDRVWVRFFEPPCAEHKGRIRTELVELQRVQPTSQAKAHEAAAAALNHPLFRPGTDDAMLGESISELSKLGFEGRLAEAALALVGGNASSAEHILRFQGQGRKVLGEVKSNEQSPEVALSALGVPQLQSQLGQKTTTMVEPARRLAPSDYKFSRAVASPSPARKPREASESSVRRLQSAGGGGGSSTPIMPGMPSANMASGGPLVVTEGLRRARRLSMGGGLGGA